MARAEKSGKSPETTWHAPARGARNVNKQVQVLSFEVPDLRGLFFPLNRSEPGLKPL